MFVTMASSLSEGMSLLVHMGVHMADLPMLVVMHVEIAGSPAAQQSHGEREDDNADDHFGGPLDRAGQSAAEEHDRKTEDRERSGMTQSPGHAQQCRSASPALLFAQQQSGYRGEVIRIERMPQAEDQRDY
jgi:hypothetical protein